MLILYILWEKYDQGDDQLIGLLKQHNAAWHIYDYVLALDEAIIGREALGDAALPMELAAFLATVLSKPQVMSQWWFYTPVETFIDFLNKNYQAQVTDPYNQKTFIRQKLAATDDGADSVALSITRDLADIIKLMAKSEEDALHMNEQLTIYEKTEMLRLLFPEKGIRTAGVYYKVARETVHISDLDVVNPKKDYTEFSFRLLLPNPDYTDSITPELNIKFPDNGATRLARGRTRAPEPGTFVALSLFYYMPAIAKKNLAAAREYISQIVMERDASEQAAYFFLEELKARIEKRLKETPDIDDYQVLIDLFTFPVTRVKTPADILNALIAKAETEFFLIIKMGKSEAFALSYRQILESQEKAQKNSRNPLRMGQFKPPPLSPLNVDDASYTVKTTNNGVYVRQKGVYEQHRDRDYDAFEPVKVQVGLIDPGVSTLTTFYRDTLGSRNWSVAEQWHIGAALPEATKQIEAYIKSVQTLKGLDLVITALSAVAVFTRPLMLTSGVLSAGNVLAVSFSRELIKDIFWFVVTDMLAEKIMAFDQEINTDKVNYSDTERTIWKVFKTGLLIFGGTAMIKQAWKGIKFLGNARFQNAFRGLEEDILKANPALKPRGISLKLEKLLSGITGSLKADKSWSKTQLGLATNTLRDLSAAAIARLKTLPKWALELLREMKDEVVRALFQCKSPCRVDLNYIKKGLAANLVEKLQLGKIRKILPAEIKALSNLSFDAWQRLMQYALRNKNIFSIKGKIAEELFFGAETFNKLYKEAIEQAAKEGIPASEVKFIRELEGIAPTATSGGTWQELTDGVFVAIIKDPGGVAEKDVLRVLGVLESKSPSNMIDLAKKDREFLGQIAMDFERFSELPVKIITESGERIFPPKQVVISRTGTKWTGIAPPGKQLSPKTIAHIREGVGSFTMVSGPVADEVLNIVAKKLRKLAVKKK